MFHVNPKTGDVSQCSAKKGQCPFGNTDLHFTTPEAARHSYEETQRIKPRITKATTIDGSTVYNILKINEAHAIAAIEKANKRLVNAGVTQRFTYTTEEYMEPNGERSGKVGLFTPKVRFTLNIPAVKFEGYTFLAAVEQAEAGLVVKQATGVNLSGYSPDNLKCDACGRAIQRQKTYLVEDAEGNMLQVGSGCVKKYFGAQPDGLWALTFDPVEKAEDSAVWYKGDISARGSAVPTEQVMAFALAASNGGEDFVSKGMAANYGGLSTSEEVQDFINSGDSADALAFQNSSQAYIDSGEAKALIEQFKQADQSTDFGRNIAVIASGEYTRWRDMATLVGGLSSLAREKREASKAKTVDQWGVAAKGYAGAVKDSFAGRELKVRKVTYKTEQDPYSYTDREITTSRVNFRDADNHEIIWWSSKKIVVEEGQVVKVKSGTVKKLSSFAGDDQTVLTRVKLDLPEIAEE